jgi:hypothetical protein
VDKDILEGEWKQMRGQAKVTEYEAGLKNNKGQPTPMK